MTVDLRTLPCFICAVAPRLPGHSVCADHHVPGRCHICNPPNRQFFNAEHTARLAKRTARVSL